MAQYGDIVARGFSKFLTMLNSMGGTLILAMIVMVNLDVFSRFFFNAPIDGVTELVELSVVAIVFLQLGDAVRNGRLTRSAGLYNRIQEKRPRIGHVLGLIHDLVGAAFFIAIIAGSLPRLVEAWERAYYSGNQGIFVVRLWPVRLIIVIGAVTVVLVFLGLVWRHVKALTGKESSSGL